MGNSNASGTTSEQEAGMSQVYIDLLDDKYKTAQNEFEKYSTLAAAAASQYTIAVQWSLELEDYLKRIDSTYELVINMDVYIESLIVHTQNICMSVNDSGKAAFLMLKYLKCFSEDIEGLKQLVKDLLETISCLNNPVLDPNVSILKCLNDLETKVKGAFDVAKVAIEKVLALYQQLINMEYLVCAEGQQDDDDTMTDTPGIMYDLRELRKILCCEYCGGFQMPAYSDWCGMEMDDMLPDGCCPPKPDAPVCIVDIEAYENGKTNDNPLPTPHLCDGGRSSSFYTTLKAEYEKAKEMEAYTKCVRDKYKELKQKALSHQNATKAALDAAKAAKARCN